MHRMTVLIFQKCRDVLREPGKMNPSERSGPPDGATLVPVIALFRVKTKCWLRGNTEVMTEMFF